MANPRGNNPKKFPRLRHFFARVGARLPIVFHLATPEHWGEAGSWLAYTLFGGLLPFWGTALILLFVRKSQPFEKYFDNGELAVFCAGLLASAIPIMRRRVKDAPVEHPGWFHFVALNCLAVILVLFASVTLTRQFQIQDVNGPAIIAWSFGLFLVSVVMGFFVELIHNVRITPAAVKAFEDKRASTLDEAFDIAKSQSDG